jgi:hypothetical protein
MSLANAVPAKTTFGALLAKYGSESEVCCRFENLSKRKSAMPRGAKSKYTGKQERQAEHIAEGYEKRGTSKKEAKRRAWATVNKVHGGGERKGGGGYGKAEHHGPMRKGGRKGGKARKSRAAGSRSGSRSSTRTASKSRS